MITDEQIEEYRRAHFFAKEVIEAYRRADNAKEPKARVGKLWSIACAAEDARTRAKDKLIIELERQMGIRT